MNSELKLELKPIRIEAANIPDAWFKCTNAIFDYGFKSLIEHGFYAGETKLEFDQIVVCVAFPYEKPYDKMLPIIPKSLKIPPLVTKGRIEQRLSYFISDYIQSDELYTYGSRIFHQIPYFVRILKENPDTNLAVLQIAAPTDNGLKNPPYLRHIDMKIKKGYLIFYPYFCLLNLWQDFSTNLGAIAVLQELMANKIGVKPGPIIASSKGLYLHEYIDKLSKMRIRK